LYIDPENKKKKKNSKTKKKTPKKRNNRKKQGGQVYGAPCHQQINEKEYESRRMYIAVQPLPQIMSTTV
jgi:hypothetical protein